MIVATAQSAVTGEVRRNGVEIRKLMRRAAQQGARLVHFPEGALSGCTREQVPRWQDFQFNAIAEELEAIAEDAKRLELWGVVGSAHRLTDPHRPHNSLYVISDAGRVVARYDKRRCSHNEVNGWYTPGFEPCVFEVDGLRFACAICIEIQFPELFIEANAQGIDCLLFSSYSKEPIFSITAQGYAATCNYWISFASPANVSRTMSSRLIGPDGQVLARCRAGVSGLTVNRIDRDAAEWEIPLRRARPWRALARAGSIYETCRVDDPRSADRTVI